MTKRLRNNVAAALGRIARIAPARIAPARIALAPIRATLISAALLLVCTALTVNVHALSGQSRKIKPAERAASGVIALMADSVANAGDSLAAYAMLDSAVHTNKRDASAWHKYGLMAWSMARSSRGQTINHSPQAIRWLLAADSAFHLAVTFAPDSAPFWRDMAHFGMNSGSVFLRFRAENWTEKGLDAATRTGDSLLVAELADDAGMIKWRRYENDADQALEVEPGPTYSDQQRQHGVGIRRDLLVKPPHSFAGFADYTEAVNFFRRASTANPINAHARHHLYMAQAERAQWPELLKASAEQLKVAPWDFEAWLARGLASARLFQTADAAAAFDSALTLMTQAQKSSYTRFTRILPPRVYGTKGLARDSISFEKLSAADQRVAEELAWALLDPLSITPENEFRNEFYARVAFADLRWTAEDLDKRGANTDRGDLYVRYGPPDLQLSLPANYGRTTLYWRYNNGLTFEFSQPAMFGVAVIGNRPNTEDLKINAPILFDNVPIAKLIDTMSVRVTAFRSTHDSLDIVVATDIPAAKLLRGSELGGQLPLNLNARVIDGFAKARQVRDNTIKLSATDAPERLSATWRQRVGLGVNYSRVEAYQPDTRRIARGTLSIDTARPTGFGISDVLLGTKLAESSHAAARWTDVIIQPVFGTFRSGEVIALLWENYQFATDGGNVRYNVNIEVKPRVANGVKGIVARVRSALGATLGQAKENSGVIDVSFPRVAPAHEVTVESMSLDLGKAPKGVYELKVQVTDAVTGIKTLRVTQFRIEN